MLRTRLWLSASACVLGICVLGVATPDDHAAAQSAFGGTPREGSDRRATIVSRGIALGIAIDHTTYPRNSLAQATIEMKNETDGAVRLAGGSINGGYTPAVEVVDRRHRVLYPPALSTGVAPPPMGGSGIVLAAGGTLRERVYMILRASHVRASVMVSTEDHPVWADIKTPGIGVKLYSAATPVVRIHPSARGSGAAYASVQRPTGASGPLVYIDSAACGDSGSTSFQQHLSWTVSRGNRIHPGCSIPTRWHAVAGWVGYPVVEFGYGQP